jgi:uncharacterized membrane protein
MSPFDLTNLAALKGWLGLPSAPGPNDATLAALITAASRSIYAALSRPSLLPFSYAETIDLETNRVTLRNWPVLQVTSVTWRGITVPPDESANLEASIGYALEPDDGVPPGRPQTLDLFGHQYRSGRQSLIVSYNAGYAIQNEAQAVPAAAPLQFTALSPYGSWGSDLGVTYTATGGSLTSVSASPNAGQYAVSAGAYTFSGADAGQSISISYGYVPQDIAQAALELAAERFRAAERIGLKSKSIGGQETIAYDTSAMSAPIQAMLQPYKRVIL